jgi:hypothetical protein
MFNVFVDVVDGNGNEVAFVNKLMWLIIMLSLLLFKLVLLLRLV